VKNHVVKSLALAVLVMLWIFFWFSEQNKADKRQGLQLQTQIDGFNREVNQLSFVPKLLSNDTTIVAALNETSDPLAGPNLLDNASNILKQAQLESGLEFSFLLNKDGKTIAASNWRDPVSFIGRDYSFRPYFINAMNGESSTYYAVGATTGIPGYFMAEPVIKKGSTIGVVVAKVNLDEVAQSWTASGNQTVLVDEFGVVILSSNEQYLYRPTVELSEETSTQIIQERRYGHHWHSENLETQKSLDFSESYKSAKTLNESNWRMISLLPKHSVLSSTALKTITTFAALLIAALLYSLYRQQHRLVSAEQRISRELETQVQERTLELEAIQKTLIAESNFAMLGRMSAAINHEINQPLATLRLNLASLRTLLGKRDLDDKSLPSIEQIVTDSDLTTKRIARVVTSLRSYARHNQVVSKAIDTNSMLQEVRQTIETERPNMSAFLSFDITPALPNISGDSTLLQQGVLNLLYNAFDAVLDGESPIVKLTANLAAPVIKYDSDRGSECGPEIVISVTDNGPGVTDTIKDSLFEPFTTDRMHNGGLGLGLTITQQIIESHDGKLQFDTSSSGSCFSIYLPSLESESNA